METAGNFLQESASGAYHCPHDAYDHGNCLPGVVLLGEVVMEPEKVVPYFGTVEKPECHMLYNVTTMASTWHTVAVKNVSLLKHQMDIVSALPKQYVFLNYLRCHDDIGWGLDYEYLKQFGFSEPAHKKFSMIISEGFIGQRRQRRIIQ